jgi:hypothetical protein
MVVAPKTFYVAGKLINTYYVILSDINNIEWALSDSGLLDEEVKQLLPLQIERVLTQVLRAVSERWQLPLRTR